MRIYSRRLYDEVAVRNNIVQVLNQDYSSVKYDALQEGFNLMTFAVASVENE